MPVAKVVYRRMDNDGFELKRHDEVLYKSKWHEN